MKLISYGEGDALVGVWLDDRVLPLAAAAAAAGVPGDFGSMRAVIRGGPVALAAAQHLATAPPATVSWVARSAVRLRAPIPDPVRNVFCVGRNYLDHVREGAAVSQAATKVPEVPQFFTKATHTLIADGECIRLDSRVTRRLDYEVELAVIIGRSGRDIDADRAIDHVFGYCVANDVTARDLQRRHDQWFKGKSLDTTLPLGPCIVTRDEVPDPRALELTLTVNGEERQRACVSDMIFDIPTIIASLSQGMTLEAGDIIATGTPAGVGYAMNPPHYLKGGDRIVARIAGIGELHNEVVEV